METHRSLDRKLSVAMDSVEQTARAGANLGRSGPGDTLETRGQTMVPRPETTIERVQRNISERKMARDGEDDDRRQSGGGGKLGNCPASRSERGASSAQNLLSQSRQRVMVNESEATRPRPKLADSKPAPQVRETDQLAGSAASATAWGGG